MSELKFFGFRPPPDRFATARLKYGKLYLIAIDMENAVKAVKSYLREHSCSPEEIDIAVRDIQEGFP